MWWEEGHNSFRVLGERSSHSLPFMDHFPSPADQRDANYYPFYCGKLGKCISFLILFDEKQKTGEILFQEGGGVSINELPFLKYNDNGKAK